MAIDEILQRDIERNGPDVNYGQDGGRGPIWRGISHLREQCERDERDEEERKEGVQVREEEKETEIEPTRAGEENERSWI